MSRRADIITAAVAIVVHGVAALAIARRDPAPHAPRPRPIEVEFRRPEPPPAPPTAASPPPAPAPRPRPIARRVATSNAPRPLAPAPAAPARPTAAKAAPVYAIAMESPTDANSPVAAPRAEGGGRAGAAGANRSGGAGSGTGSGASSGSGSASGLGIKRMPEIDTDACGRSIAYPPEAERAGVEGKVRLRVALDAGGRVTSARVLRGLGHGLDQAAVEALTRRCRFTPALATDGRPVPFVIESYSFVFELPR